MSVTETQSSTIDDWDAVWGLQQGEAADRAEDLGGVGNDLASGHHQPTATDVALPDHRAAQAHLRTRRGHLAAAERHRLAAEAHDRTAQTHDRAAKQGIGDVATHLKAVALHRAARDSEYRAAAADLRLAERA